MHNFAKTWRCRTKAQGYRRLLELCFLVAQAPPELLLSWFVRRRPTWHAESVHGTSKIYEVLEFP